MILTNIFFNSLNIKCEDMSGWESAYSYEPFEISLSIPSEINESNDTLTPKTIYPERAQCNLILGKKTGANRYDIISTSKTGKLTLFDLAWGEHKLNIDSDGFNGVTLNCTDLIGYEIQETKDFSYLNTPPTIF